MGLVPKEHEPREPSPCMIVSYIYLKIVLNLGVVDVPTGAVNVAAGLHQMYSQGSLFVVYR